MVQDNVLPLSGVVCSHRQRSRACVVWANVVFGQPTLACRGNGLCRVDLITAGKAMTHCQPGSGVDVCAYVPVRLYHNGSEGLQLIVSVKSLSEETYRRQFRQSFFSMGEAFQLSELVTKALNLKRSFLPKGKYPMKKTKDHIIVYLLDGIEK